MSLAYSNGSTIKNDHPSFLIYPLILTIRIYQWTLSPVLSALLGGTCRFEPSCSRYAVEALRKHGLLRGSVMAVKRISRCHPWHEGGFDPVE